MCINYHLPVPDPSICRMLGLVGGCVLLVDATLAAACVLTTTFLSPTLNTQCAGAGGRLRAAGGRGGGPTGANQVRGGQGAGEGATPDRAPEQGSLEAEPLGVTPYMRQTRLPFPTSHRQVDRPPPPASAIAPGPTWISQGLQYPVCASAAHALALTPRPTPRQVDQPAASRGLQYPVCDPSYTASLKAPSHPLPPPG